MINFKLYFNVFLIFCSLFFFQCGGGSSDFYEELSGNYFYRGEGRGSNEILSHSPKQKSIYSEVINYSFNDDFIIALQQPNYESHKYMIATKLRIDAIQFPTNSSQEIKASEKIAASLLKHDSFYLKIFSQKRNFWIITNKPNKLYGPLNNEQYLQKREELNVPKELELK